MKKICSLLLVLSFMLLFATSIVVAEDTYNIKVGIGLNDNSADYKCLEFFKKLVENETNNKKQK